MINSFFTPTLRKWLLFEPWLHVWQEVINFCVFKIFVIVISNALSAESNRCFFFHSCNWTKLSIPFFPLSPIIISGEPIHMKLIQWVICLYTEHVMQVEHIMCQSSSNMHKMQVRTWSNDELWYMACTILNSLIPSVGLTLHTNCSFIFCHDSINTSLQNSCELLFICEHNKTKSFCFLEWDGTAISDIRSSIALVSMLVASQAINQPFGFV